MLNRDKGPRGGLVVWLMAVIVVCLAPAMHPIAADIAVLSPVSGRGCPVFQCREEPPSPFLLSLFHYTRVVI
ncbi:hypothetical protein [Bifidobacterium longum]|uniref:hypothetical protein n=1 Tax=Bifidobacterium longum TaxID=216816 RepID=UPI00103A3F04|nr:hypothetical protein [Bifidobacterium longum]TCD81686.1 hypothetical protein MCC10007_0984 [Bifidobacterium longum subsp. longum]